MSGPPTGRSHEEAFGLIREPLQVTQRPSCFIHGEGPKPHPHESTLGADRIYEESAPLSSEVWEGRLILAEETLLQLSGSLALLPVSRDSWGRNWAQPGWKELVLEEGRVRARQPGLHRV